MNVPTFQIRKLSHSEVKKLPSLSPSQAFAQLELRLAGSRAGLEGGSESWNFMASPLEPK